MKTLLKKNIFLYCSTIAEVLALDKIWKVVFEGADPGPADDFTLEFIDLRALHGLMGLQQKTIEKMLKLFDTQDNYHILGNIKEITSPSGKDFSKKEIYALLGINVQQMRFGVLLGRTETDIILMGVWPKYFAGAIKEDEKFLNYVFSAFIDLPDTWTRVDLITTIT